MLAADGVIQGTVWFDEDQNGAWDNHERGLSGVTVYIDVDGDGQLGDGEPYTLTAADDPLTVDIDEAGRYLFTGLDPGTYQVRVQLDPDLQQTAPLADPVFDNLIVNGSFEEAFLGWTNVQGAASRSWAVQRTGSQGLDCGPEPMLEGITPRDGDWVAYTRFDTTLEDKSQNTYLLYQDVDLSAAQEALLEFQFRLQWNLDCKYSVSEYLAPGVNHPFNVEIRDPDTDAVLHTLEVAALRWDGPTTWDTGWQTVTLPLDQFTGQEVRVALVADVQQELVRRVNLEVDVVQVLVPGEVDENPPHLVEVGSGEVSAANFGIYTQLPINQAPVLTGPGQRSTLEDTPVSLAGLVELADADAGDQPIALALTVDVGQIDLPATDGVTIVGGDPITGNNLLLQGSVAALNAAIAGATYHPPADFHGEVTLQALANDVGNSGFGGAQAAYLASTIEVESVNDLPEVANPLEPLTVLPIFLRHTVDLSQLFTDVDVAQGNDELTLSVSDNSAPHLVTPQLNGEELTLQFAWGASGTATLELTATDSHGETATFQWEVTMQPASSASVRLAAHNDPAVAGWVENEVLPPGIFHEWQDLSGQLWLTVQEDLQFHPFDLRWYIESEVTWYTPGQITSHLGEDAWLTIEPGDEGTSRIVGTIEHLDLSQYQPGSRVLLATWSLPRNLEDLAGVPNDASGDYPHASESGLTLAAALDAISGRMLQSVPEVEGRVAPVVYDANDNGSVGLYDFSEFVQQFGKTVASSEPDSYRFDYNRDGRVSLADFAMFVQHFGLRKQTFASDDAIDMPVLLEPPLDENGFPPMEGEMIDYPPYLCFGPSEPVVPSQPESPYSQYLEIEPGVFVLPEPVVTAVDLAFQTLPEEDLWPVTLREQEDEEPSALEESLQSLSSVFPEDD